MLLHQPVSIKESLAELTLEERYTKRLELEKPVLDALLAWTNETEPKTAPKSAPGKALHNLLEQWLYLVRHLEDGRLELSICPRRTQYKARCNAPEELALSQHTSRSSIQCFDLQFDRDSEGEPSGSVPISTLGSAKRTGNEPGRCRLG